MEHTSDPVMDYVNSRLRSPSTGRLTMADAHTQDSDCSVDPDTDLCRSCGVYHGEACQTCGGKGFHQYECVAIAPESQVHCPTCKMLFPECGCIAVHHEVKAVMDTYRSLFKRPAEQLLNGYDYRNQAWVRNGRYVRCGHPQTMNCGCYGKVHQGEQVHPGTVIG